MTVGSRWTNATHAYKSRAAMVGRWNTTLS